VIDRLKLMANDLVQLERNKQQAIAGEDFGAAKSLKIQIERLQLFLNSVDPNNPFAPLPQD
jgi:hypothetical protein